MRAKQRTFKLEKSDTKINNQMHRELHNNSFDTQRSKNLKNHTTTNLDENTSTTPKEIQKDSKEIILD